MLAQCKCRRTLTTKFGQVCVERYAARREETQKVGPSYGLASSQEASPGHRSTRAVDTNNIKQNKIKRPSPPSAPRRGATLAPQGARSASATGLPTKEP